MPQMSGKYYEDQAAIDSWTTPNDANPPEFRTAVVRLRPRQPGVPPDLRPPTGSRTFVPDSPANPSSC
ncbi:hypothetical protein GCM10020220_017100 [Nonomuraea rubra]